MSYCSACEDGESYSLSEDEKDAEVNPYYWNEAFQGYLYGENTRKRYKKLSALAKDFTYAASGKFVSWSV
jgi:hypothetical protein